VEFKLEEGISDEEAIRLIQLPDDSKPDCSWKEGEAEVMGFEDTNQQDPFSAQVINFDVSIFQNLHFKMFKYYLNRDHLKALEPQEVIIMKWPLPLGNKYYRNLLPDVPIANCQTCNKV
jgi:hypothetical protein